jgi:glycerophosphoryl diester phosphodiesterase
MKNLRNLLALLLAIPVFNLLFYRLLRGAKPRTVQIVAHRGGAALATENTEAAFNNAVSVHADWIEFDIHRTIDGVLVIMHDDTVNRMTNGKGYIKDMTWEQLRRLRITNGEPIMTFEEVVTLAKKASMGILPELKSTSYYPDMEVQALEIVRRADYLSKTIFLSFDWDALEHLKELEPEIKVAVLYGLGQWDVSEPRPANAEIIAPMAEMVMVNPWMIRQAHAGGHQVWVWFGVLDRPAMYRLMLSLGVDGLICNDPVTARQLVGQANQLAVPFPEARS